jgi:hypothetical protein
LCDSPPVTEPVALNWIQYWIAIVGVNLHSIF